MARNDTIVNTRLLPEVLSRLEQHYGRREFKPRRDPLSGLIWTVLTQNTTDLTADRAYREMRRQLPTWEQVMNAPAKKVQAAIRVCGLHEQKARTIQLFLKRLQSERGSLSLAFLKKMCPQEASDWLTSSPGIGIKTAAVVLLFRMGMPLMAVDTHIRRVCGRVGLVPEGTAAAKTQQLLAAHVPSSARECAQMHLDLIWLGRDICHARGPDCGQCPLLDICRDARRRKVPGAD